MAVGGVLFFADLWPDPSLRRTFRTLPRPPPLLRPVLDDDPFDLAQPLALLESSAAEEDVGRRHTSQDSGRLRGISVPLATAVAIQPSPGEKKPFEHAQVMTSSCEATSVRQVLMAWILRWILSLLEPGQASGAGTGARGGSGWDCGATATVAGVEMDGPVMSVMGE